MVPRSDEIECQGQGPKVKGQGHHGQKTGFSTDISGIAELICYKFTRKTCLVPRSEELEGQGQFRRPVCGSCLENIFALVFSCFRVFVSGVLTENAQLVEEVKRYDAVERYIFYVDQLRG